MEKQNPFKKINLPIKEVPIELRNKIIDNTSVLNLFINIAELFTFNYKNIIDSLLQTRKQTKKTN